MPCRSAEVVAVGTGEPGRPRGGGEHLLARLRAALLLQARVVVRRHDGEGGDFLAPQAGGPAPGTVRQADIRPPQRLTAAAQEVRESCSVHVSSIGRALAADPGTVGPRITGLCTERDG